MFSKSKKEPGNKPAAQVSRKPAAPSIIGADLRIVGDLKSEGEVQVDGFIDGDIRTKVLLIGESATVKGEIVSDTVRVYGKVNGQIKARAVTLAKSAGQNHLRTPAETSENTGMEIRVLPSA